MGQQENDRRSRAGSSNRRIRPVLWVLFPVLILTLGSDCRAQQGATRTLAPPNNAFPQPLTGKERWKRFWNETFLPPWPYVVSLGAGLAYQALDYPKEWGGGFKGFGRRSGSQFGILAIQNIIHDGGEAALRYEPRYFPCRCTGLWRRTGHAVEMSFLTYDENGRKRLDLPQLAGAYGSGALSALWYPKRYTVLVQGIQTGHLQFGLVMGTNLFEEFHPEFQRTWPFRKFLDRSSGKPPERPKTVGSSSH